MVENEFGQTSYSDSQSINMDDIDVMMEDLNQLFEYFNTKFNDLFLNDSFYVFD